MLTLLAAVNTEKPEVGDIAEALLTYQGQTDMQDVKVTISSYKTGDDFRQLIEMDIPGFFTITMSSSFVPRAVDPIGAPQTFFTLEELEELTGSISGLALVCWERNAVLDDAIDIEYDLTEISLVDHKLPADSLFEPAAIEGSMGNIYMVSEPVEAIRDPVGVHSHDGIRFAYNALNTSPALRFDPVILLEEGARDSMLADDRRVLPMGPIHTNPDRTAAYIAFRFHMLDVEATQFYIAQMMPDTGQIIVLNLWLWSICADEFSNIRHAAVVELGQHIGIDLISYFDGVSALD